MTVNHGNADSRVGEQVRAIIENLEYERAKWEQAYHDVMTVGDFPTELQDRVALTDNNEQLQAHVSNLKHEVAKYKRMVQERIEAINGLNEELRALRLSRKSLAEELRDAVLENTTLEVKVEELEQEVIREIAGREEALAEVQEVRRMFDVTRHRVLQRMGEPDKGKSWNWIESQVTAPRPMPLNAGPLAGLKVVATDHLSADVILVHTSLYKRISGEQS
jgi:predicted RNase H-like nuclease (RuvC/YqgF family)